MVVSVNSIGPAELTSGENEQRLSALSRAPIPHLVLHPSVLHQKLGIALIAIINLSTIHKCQYRIQAMWANMHHEFFVVPAGSVVNHRVKVRFLCGLPLAIKLALSNTLYSLTVCSCVAYSAVGHSIGQL